MNFMLTTNQKYITGTQKIKRKQYKHNTKESQQVTREGKKRRRKELRRIHKNSQKTILQMAVNIYLSIITLNANVLNASIKRHRVNG